MTTFCKFDSDKYKINGAYHWTWYRRKAKYIRHVNHVKEWIKEKNGLDVGAGDGLITSVLGIKGIDYDPEAIRLANQQGVIIDLGDAHDLPNKDEEFEFVFMGDVLEHLEFPQKAISEARRVLTKYLYIIVSIVEGPFRISQDEFKKMVEREGFALEGKIWAEDQALWGKFKKIDSLVPTISILLPTRGRPESFKKMCLSVLENASEPNDIEFVSYHDHDDPSVYEYVGNHQEVVGERIVQSSTFNKCYKKAAGPIYMWTCDDIYFVTKGWDTLIKETFDKSKDKVIFVHPNDRYHRSRFGIVGFLHRNWIDTVGYFLPPYFAAGCADKWINDLANIINRRVFLREIRITNARIANDQTHQEYLSNVRRSDGRSHALAIYRSKKTERDKDAQLLQNFIDNFQ